MVAGVALVEADDVILHALSVSCGACALGLTSEELERAMVTNAMICAMSVDDLLAGADKLRAMNVRPEGAYQARVSRTQAELFLADARVLRPPFLAPPVDAVDLDGGELVGLVGDVAIVAVPD